MLVRILTPEEPKILNNVKTAAAKINEQYQSVVEVEYIDGKKEEFVGSTIVSTYVNSEAL